MFRSLLGVALIIWAGSLLAQSQPTTTLPPTVAQALSGAQIPASAVAVVVQPVDAPTPSLVHNTRTPMNPASVMKLLTTYGALEILGPAATWQTGAWSDVAPGPDGRLAGNLYLKGSGDPKFSLEQFWLLLRQLQARGIRQIDGDLVLDRSAFAVSPVDPGAFDNKPMRPYNVGPDALLVNFRALRFTLQPENGSVRVISETPSEGLLIDNQLRLGQGECGDWKEKFDLRYAPDSRRLELRGVFAESCGEKALYLSPMSADQQVEALFRTLWRELGGSLRGRVREGSSPTGLRLLASQESPPLADMVRDINKYSNNVMARQIFLALGNSNGQGATVERARQRLDNWLAYKGLNFPELVLENGSGLSRVERINADSLDRLLISAWQSPVMPEFVSSLPIAGIDGTMKKRLKDTLASGRAHIKTGSLEGARAVAGYALDGQGRHYAVVFLVNHPKAAASQPAIDALLLWIAQGGAAR